MSTPQKFQKRPVVIEAIRYIRGENEDEIMHFVSLYTSEDDDDPVYTVDAYGMASIDRVDHMLVNTIEGEMSLNDGSWLIRGVKGEFYPCRDDIFRETYIEAAELDSSKKCLSRGMNEWEGTCEAAQAEALRPPVSRFRALVEAQIQKYKDSGLDFVERCTERKEKLDRIRPISGPEWDKGMLEFEVSLAADAELITEERGYLP